VSKLGKIFKGISSLSPIHRLAPLFQKKEKQFIQLKSPETTPAPSPAVKTTSVKEGSERRRRIASRLKSGGISDDSVAKINAEDDSDVIRRAAARRAKLLGA